jgi:gliding motility-associated-like protein
MKNKILYCFLFLQGILFSQENKVWLHPNRGQWYEKINYKVDLNGGSMFIEQNAFTYLFHNVSDVKHSLHHGDKKFADETQFLDLVSQHCIKTTFLGSNSEHQIIESNYSNFYLNYFLGRDESKWKTNVHSISELVYPNFYDGIEMEMEGKTSSFKYSFTINPGINPSTIKYKIEGANDIKIDKNGNLIIYHSFGKIEESKPIAWTISANGTKIPVEIKFNIKNDLVSFEFPNSYNNSEQLIIDPEITFSTYSGSTTDNWGCTATPDSQGNLFAGGTVFGPGYPTTPGALSGGYIGGENIGYSGFDVGITKFNANGTARLYSTYLGGEGNETPNSMICNEANELYVMGITSSDTDFPVNGSSYDNTHNGGSVLNLESSQGFSNTDIYVARINPTGTALMNSTYIGGSANDGINQGSSNLNDGDLSNNYGDNFRGEIILDENENVFIASSTRSDNFPTINSSQLNLNGIQDAVIFKFNPTLSSLLWSTYYGGSGIDSGNALSINSLGEVYLTGGSNSNDLIVPNGHVNINSGGSSDAYITRFNPTNGTILSGTYLGTNSYDQAYFVQIDIDDFVYVYGQSLGTMPISPGLVGNADAHQFIRKYTTSLSAVEWNTKVGGSNERISPTAFLVSNCYEIYISGWGGSILNTNISGFAITPDAFQTTSNGDGFYIAVFDPNMTALQYGTFMGGSADDHVDGGTSRFDKNGRIYHAVCASCGPGNNGFVSTPGVVSPFEMDAEGNCNLAAFKFELNSIKAIFAEPNFIICIPNPVQFFNNSTVGDVFFWDFGDGNTSNEDNPEHNYLNVGYYDVKLVVSDSEGCKTPDSVSFVITVGSFEAGSVLPPPTVCRGTPYQLEAFGGLHYLWSPANVLDDPTISNPTAIIFDTTTFSVIISDTCGIDTVVVTLNVFPDEISLSPDTALCIGNAVQIEVFGSINQVWTPNTFITNNQDNNPTVNPDTNTYYVVLATTPNNCVFEDSILIEVYYAPPVPIIDDSTLICFGAPLEINVDGARYYSWNPNLFINTTTGNQVIVSPPSDMTYYCDFINPCGAVLDSIYIDVIVPRVNAYNDTTICDGETAIMRADGAVNYQWSPTSSLDNPLAQEVIATPINTTNYIVVGIDEYGCRDSASVLVELFPTHQVDAGGSIFAYIGEKVQLNATADIEGVYVWSPESFLTCSVCPDPIASPNHNFSYTVTFIDTNGCQTNDLIHISYKGIIYVPNTFTPDGSKFNEVFKAYGEGIKDFEMLIFNRWGELIKTLNSIDEFWDGTYKGKMCQDGTYTWKLTFNDITGVYQTLTGHVNLLK